LHDNAALNAPQCREACGLRAKNEPLATDATLRQTARIVKHEDACCDSARQPRQTTKRAADNNAGQPETAECMQLMRSQNATRTRSNCEGKML
jgi:hypothetical protein